ncbi:response regulator [Actinocatenispora thailandica]|uniref:response regulator n=1 Tax=Actinocatenispora thailandica TaxID=227318 RepID=UPI00194E9E6A|nr:response regulator [Actinocatenispora thailandica]
MLKVLVVEDDFRVAEVHVAFTEQVDGFTVVGTARTVADGRRLAAETRPDLLLLDRYLPDDSGLTLLREVSVDAILLTAAADTETVRAAYAHGALNYLVKPFTAEQLADRLRGYARYRAALAAPGTLTQPDIDRAIRLLHEGDRTAAPKGHSPVTARLVADALQAAAEPRSAATVAAELGIARATAQRYLASLAESGRATMTLRYGTTGRPEHLYSWLPR